MMCHKRNLFIIVVLGLFSAPVHAEGIGFGVAQAQQESTSTIQAPAQQEKTLEVSTGNPKEQANPQKEMKQNAVEVLKSTSVMEAPQPAGRELLKAATQAVQANPETILEREEKIRARFGELEIKRKEIMKKRREVMGAGGGATDKIAELEKLRQEQSENEENLRRARLERDDLAKQEREDFQKRSEELNRRKDYKALNQERQEMLKRVHDLMRLGLQ